MNFNLESNTRESYVRCLELANRGSRARGSCACTLPKIRAPLGHESPITKIVRDDRRNGQTVIRNPRLLCQFLYHALFEHFLCALLHSTSTQNGRIRSLPRVYIELNTNQ
jgi:hypothetical protein